MKEMKVEDSTDEVTTLLMVLIDVGLLVYGTSAKSVRTKWLMNMGVTLGLKSNFLNKTYKTKVKTFQG